MDLNAQNDSGNDSARQAGASSLDIKVSETMIRAGAAVLADEAGVCGISAAEELAALVFTAMMRAYRDSLSTRHEEESR
jgi:regulator of RNase E activity RraA